MRQGLSLCTGVGCVNVDLLIFPPYSAALFRKSLYYIPSAHLDLQNDSLLSWQRRRLYFWSVRVQHFLNGCEHWTFCSALTRQTFFPLTHTLFFASFIIAVVTTTLKSVISTEKELQGRPRVHLTKPMRLKWTLQSFDKFQCSFHTIIRWSNFTSLA